MSVVAGSVTLTVEEQSTESTAKSRAFLVTVNNLSGRDIYIFKRGYDVPQGVLNEPFTDGRSLGFATDEQLRYEIQETLNTLLDLGTLTKLEDQNNAEGRQVGNQDIEKLFKSVISLVGRALNPAHAIVSGLSSILLDTIKEQSPELKMRRRLQSFNRFTIRSNREALELLREVYPSALSKTDDLLGADPITASLRSKVLALGLERSVDPFESDPATRLASGQSVAIQVAFRFPPSLLRDVSYPVTFNLRFGDGATDRSTERTLSAPISVYVRANAFTVGLTTVLTSWLWLFLNPTLRVNVYSLCLKHAAIVDYPSALVSAPAFGFLAFLLYDHTDLKKRLEGLASWKIAITIAFLAASQSDKLQEALKAIIRLR